MEIGEKKQKLEKKKKKKNINFTVVLRKCLVHGHILEMCEQLTGKILIWVKFLFM